jgi:hypothetical protein
MCPRKWWYKSFVKLPEPPTKATTLGDVGHSVIGRFLEGKELYPKGWEQADDRWKPGVKVGNPLTTTEQSLVQALVHNGIQRGTIAREPDGIVEQEIKLAVSDLKVPVQINMFLDYATQHSVQDHKFCGNTKYYSKDKLAKAVPMLFYALAQWENGNCKDDALWLRYNLFVKNPADPATKTVEVEVTKDSVMRWYENTMLPVIGEIVDLYERNERGDWHKVQGAEDKRDACTAYGGCPFLSVCSGQQTMEEYKQSHGEVDQEARRKQEDAVLEGLRQATTGNAGKTEEKNMTNFREKMLAAKKGQNETPPPQELAPEVVETEVAETVAATGNDTDTPTAPWWNDKCVGCKDNAVRGFNSNGKVCAICVALNKKAGIAVNATDYQIVNNEDGSVMIVNGEGEIVLDTAPPAVREAREVVVPVAEPDPEPEPEPAPAPVPPKAKPAVKAEPQPEPETPVLTGEFDPERLTFTLSYVPVRQKKRTSRKLGDSNCVVHIAELTEMVAKELAESHNAATGKSLEYYEISAFTRRDLIATNGKAIADLLGNSVVEADTVQRATDEAHICAAIERYASVVYGSMV